jgi:hypothetical protein
MYRRSSAPRALARRPSTPTSKPAPEVVVLRPVRSRALLPLLAALATLGFVLVSIVDPYSGAYASETNAPADPRAAQTYTAGGQMTQGVGRDGYGLTKAAPPAPPAAKKVAKSYAAPAAGTPDPGTAQAIAKDMLAQRGWGQDQFDCLVALWNKESHWNVYSNNTRTGAYGIPQALPGSKMASAGADWQTNPATQITWGLGYITGRYGTPCGAWAKSQASGWY